MQALSAAVAKESHSGTLDNICGAICKMIVTNSAGVPLEQVFPVLLQHLPLKEDYQENEAVIKSFFTLYQQGNDVLRAHLAHVIKIVAQVLHKKQTPNEGKFLLFFSEFFLNTIHLIEIKNLAIEFLKTVNRDFSEEFAKSVSDLGPEVTASVQKLFS